LYIRGHLVTVQKKLDDFLKNEKHNQLYITGPPGCGKTCFMYLWARRLSVLQQKRVLIVQFREKEPGIIWIREADGALWRMDEAIDRSLLEREVQKIIEKNEDAGTLFDLCIHDGVLDKLEICSSMLSTLNTAVANKLIKKVAHVTSLAFKLSTGGQLLNNRLSRIVEASLDSWHEEDYQKAVSCKAFMNEMAKSTDNPFPADMRFLLTSAGPDDAEDPAEEKESMSSSDTPMDHNDTKGNTTLSALEVVEAKYFYAGGSARFMFQTLLENLKLDLDKRMSGVMQGDWQSFTQKSVSPRTASVVNILMQQFERVCTPLSKYVLFCAYEKCKSDLVKSVRAAADSSGNPALAGWAFELEQIDLIRLSYESSNGGNPVYATNGYGLSFRPTSQAEFDETRVTSGVVKDGTVIWCQKWNQGYFDVAFYGEGTLITYSSRCKSRIL
jgi:hypothetical protein